nr:NADH dehydrogenase subunit 5 [Ptilocnemus lemur]
MKKLSIYLLGFQFLLFIGFILLFIGFILILNDIYYFIDWELLMINSCNLTMTIIVDWMSMLFMGCVLIISSMVVMYSDVYMLSDMYKNRFFLLVLLFVISMMLMIISPNLISILLGWDGLGLISYCLVIYFQNYKSYSAGMVTILTNRVGDVFMLVSIAWMLNFGSWHFIYYSFFWEKWMFFMICLIILAGFTKSAQIPFSSWLPAAMAAPTPVSALVHSSTLVTAGVYLIIRFNNLLFYFDSWFFLMLSMMTMFMSGLGANFEFDLSKIIALSTLSQLGLMMSIIFLGYGKLAFFHLLTHAFFKALLFLCAGLIIHCVLESQDIRYMGCISNHLPLTCCCFCISNLSLCGIPFMSGFYSKDLIVEMMMFSYYNFFVVFVFMLSIGLTVSYSFRLVFYSLIYNMSYNSFQLYYEDFLMMSSMLLLTFFSILGGSLISWLILFDPIVLVFPFIYSVLPILFVMLGIYLGYFFFNLSIDFMINYSFYLYFVGNMWFMPAYSTYFLSSLTLEFSKNLISVMDSGWGEFIVSKSSLGISSNLSKVFYFWSYHNLSVFMLVYIFMVMVIII